MLHFAFTLVLFFCSSSIRGKSVIYLNQGELSGKIITTRNGRNISAYLGIPYAEPPVGQLRFKNPQPWTRTNQVIKADTDGNECPQFNDDGKLVGDEDCLFLNVYSPNTSPQELYPTMVFFHGGDYFLKGSGSSTNAGPEYLLDKDIILVTVNYRLGALGFLSTGDAEAPGNFGFKDQIVALQWIQTNIANFGGDPTKVTIFGQGAGGVSAGIFAIFEHTRDLFSQYISQSGSPLAIWGYEDIDTYKKRAFDLGNYVKCPTENSQVLINCLRSLDAYSLVDSLVIFTDQKWVFRTWGPTKEPADLEGALITMDPLQKMMKDGIKDCPIINGDVSNDGLIVTAEYYSKETVYNSIRKNVFAYLEYVISTFFYTATPKIYANLVQHFYFDGVEASDKKTFIQNMTNFFTDSAFRLPIDIEARIINNDMKYHDRFYSYVFDYRGTFSKTSAKLGNNDKVGVDHGDELIYLFPVKTSDIEMNESDEMMIDIMVDFWTSFAYTGNPTSEHISDSKIWKPNVYEEGMLLKIGENSDPKDVKEYPVVDRRLMFWQILLPSLSL